MAHYTGISAAEVAPGSGKMSLIWQPVTQYCWKRAKKFAVLPSGLTRPRSIGVPKRPAGLTRYPKIATEMFADCPAVAPILKTEVNFILVPCSAAVYMRLLDRIGRGMREAEPLFMYLDLLV